MNCANHPETAAVAYCRTCGKPLCQACERIAQGTVFCEEHYAATAGNPAPGVSSAASAASVPGAHPYSPYTAPYPGGDPASSPGLAFILGLIPGVGAIYNGQYAKGLVHVLILGLLISIMANGAAGGFEPLFGMLIGLWVLYMPFEAFHTARRRLRGEPVEEFSSLMPLRQSSGGFPITPIILILVGVVFLLNNLEVIRLYQILRYWPVVLIVLGAYLLYVRVSAARQDVIGSTAPEVSNER